MTDLFLILFVLSGIFAVMGLAALVIERWPALVAVRPRRAPARIRRAPRRGRSRHLRRLPRWAGGAAVPGDCGVAPAPAEPERVSPTGTV